jgi:hypothetical protein
MGKYSVRLVMLALLASAVLTQPSHAITGHVRVVFAKAGLVAGAGVGRGVLTFRGRDYPFKVSGLSLGFTAGASLVRLEGRASYLNELSDFPGIYSSVGVGGALGGGAGGVQLKNAKGVIISLQGKRVGIEFSANLSGIEFTLQ